MPKAQVHRHTIHTHTQRHEYGHRHRQGHWRKHARARMHTHRTTDVFCSTQEACTCVTWSILLIVAGPAPALPRRAPKDKPLAQAGSSSRASHKQYPRASSPKSLPAPLELSSCRPHPNMDTRTLVNRHRQPHQLWGSRAVRLSCLRCATATLFLRLWRGIGRCGW